MIQALRRPELRRLLGLVVVLAVIVVVFAAASHAGLAGHHAKAACDTCLTVAGFRDAPVGVAVVFVEPLLAQHRAIADTTVAPRSAARPRAHATRAPPSATTLS